MLDSNGYSQDVKTRMKPNAEWTKRDFVTRVCNGRRKTVPVGNEVWRSGDIAPRILKLGSPAALSSW